ncbi:hemicentin-1, partial [Trichonephila clavata]
MLRRVILNAHLFFFLFVWNLRECDCVSGVIYEGRKYVAEGFPFSITCLKSSYGVPKWTRNGLAIDQLDPDTFQRERGGIKSSSKSAIEAEQNVETSLRSRRKRCIPHKLVQRRFKDSGIPRKPPRSHGREGSFYLQSDRKRLGEYMCVIEMAGLSYPFAHHLGSRIKVTYPARVKQLPTQIRPILNRNLSIQCEVQGFPIPRVSWFV